jgi:hypothetical protein
LVRSLGSPDPIGLEEDFALYPDFLSLNQSRKLLDGALWKLDRVDPTRKRRKRSQEAIGAKIGGPAPLQDLFQGIYGFEEVS